jgi:NADH dehydrogenase FAD-containing subunit
MRKHLILVGGGHAHLTTLANIHGLIRRGHRVTVIGPSDHHYYSGMGPGMLGGFYTARQIRFAIRRMVERQGGRFVRAKVVRIDPDRQTVFTDSGEDCPYDVVSFNSGSFVPSGIVRQTGPTLFTVKPIEALLEARRMLLGLSLRSHLAVAVIGGGPAAVEIAGNTCRLLGLKHCQNHAIHLYTRGRLLHHFPTKVRAAVMQSFRSRGIQIHEQREAVAIGCNEIDFKTGNCVRADFIFLATGVQPSAIFEASGLPTGPSGGLAVNRYLQSTAHANIFGGGDCIYFERKPLEKAGVYAVRQNPVLYHNLVAALEGNALRPFSPGGAFVLIFNLGDGTGLLVKRGLLLKGRLAFLLKDLIDRRFMRKFQSFE